MRIHEIENYLEKKVRRTCWDPNEHIYLSKGIWFDEDDNYYFLEPTHVSYDDWEEYTEPAPPKVKRYWQWIIGRGGPYEGICKSDCYLNDDGETSKGKKFFGDWDKTQKIKLENEWVGINDEGEIVDWSPK